MKKTKYPYQRKKNGPITQRNYIKGCFGNVEIEITTSCQGWDALKWNSQTDARFADNFLISIVNPVIAFMKKPPKNHDTNIKFVQMKIAAALLVRHFKNHKTKDPLVASMQYMKRLYPEKKNIFDPYLDRESVRTGAKEIFRPGYLSDGNKIVQKLEKNNYNWEALVLLEFYLRVRMEKAKSAKARKDAAFAHDLVIAFVDDLQKTA